MTNSIRHSGIVDKVEDGCIKVRIVQMAACSSCKIAGHCNVSEGKDKIVDVYGNSPEVSAGDRVMVVASQKTGFLGVFLSSVVPLLILVMVLAVVLFFTGNEPLSALSALVSLVPYYYILYVSRNKIRKRLSFHIEAMP